MSNGGISDALGYPGHSIAEALEKGGAIGGGQIEVIDCSGYDLSLDYMIAGGQTIESLEIANKFRNAYNSHKPVAVCSEFGVSVGGMMKYGSYDIIVSSVVPIVISTEGQFSLAIVFHISVSTNAEALQTVTFRAMPVQLPLANID